VGLGRAAVGHVDLSERARRVMRRGLLRAGRHLGDGHLVDLRTSLGYLELGAWMRHEGARVEAFAGKEALFARAAAEVRGERPLYLEFGVFEGQSLRWWSDHLRQPGARLVGFDSFDGLPEDWRPNTAAGTFAVTAPPRFDDPRVSLQVGWFEDTLAAFEIPAHDRLIVNIDCDLYSSAATVLRWLEPHLVPGTLIYFDELPDRDHELRALMEHLRRTAARLEPLGIAAGGVHWLFRYG
jgi:hypothetical protein